MWMPASRSVILPNSAMPEMSIEVSRFLLLINARRGIAKDELDLFPAGFRHEPFLESVDLSQRVGSKPLMAAADEMHQTRRLARGRQWRQINASQFAPRLDGKRWIDQTFLSRVLCGIVIVR